MLWIQSNDTSEIILNLASSISSAPIVKNVKQDEYTIASLVFITIPAFAAIACDSYSFTNNDPILTAMKEYSSMYRLPVFKPNNWDFRKLATKFKIDIEIHRRLSSLLKRIYWYTAKVKRRHKDIPEEERFSSPISKTAYLFFADGDGERQIFPYSTSIFTRQYDEEKITNPLVLANYVRVETAIVPRIEESTFAQSLVSDEIVLDLLGDGNCWIYCLIMIIPDFSREICMKKDNQFLVDNV